MKANLFLATLACAILLPSCTTVSSIADGVEWSITRATSNPNSFRLNKETVEIEFDLKASSEGEAESASAVGAFAATFVAGEVVRGFEQAAKNYSITYSASTLGRDLNTLSGFYLIRKVNGVEASRIHFTVHDYSQGYQYIALDYVKVTKSKTAIPFWDGDMDLIVDLKISTPKAGVNSGTAVVTPGKLVVRDVALGEERPKNGIHQPLSGTGLFEPNSKPFFLQITVQEVSDFNDIAEKGATLISKNKEDWQKQLADAISGE